MGRLKTICRNIVRSIAAAVIIAGTVLPAMAASGTQMNAGSLSEWLNKNCTEEEATGIRCASIFGYPNYNNGTNDDANYIATQFIIWEYAEGFRTSADGDNPTAGLNGKLTSSQLNTQAMLRNWLGNANFDIRQRFYLYRDTS